MSTTKEFVSFNINSYVYVKLTKKGLDILKKEHDDLKYFYGDKGSLPDFEPPAANSDGYSKFQLWSLMATFGGDCFNGCDVPFETTFLIDKEYLDEI